MCFHVLVMMSVGLGPKKVLEGLLLSWKQYANLGVEVMGLRPEC